MTILFERNRHVLKNEVLNNNIFNILLLSPNNKDVVLLVNKIQFYTPKIYAMFGQYLSEDFKELSLKR